MWKYECNVFPQQSSKYTGVNQGEEEDTASAENAGLMRWAGKLILKQKLCSLNSA